MKSPKEKVNHVQHTPVHEAGEAVENGVQQLLDYMFKGAGGLAELRKRLRRADLNREFASWINHGKKQAVSTEKVGEILGPDLKKLSARSGLEKEKVAALVAEHLPTYVDQRMRGEQAAK